MKQLGGRFSRYGSNYLQKGGLCSVTRKVLLKENRDVILWETAKSS